MIKFKFDTDTERDKIEFNVLEDWPLDNDPETTFDELQETCLDVDDTFIIIKKDELKALIDALTLAYENIKKAEEMYRNGEFSNEG